MTINTADNPERGDGAALHSVTHPHEIEITEEMIAAGLTATTREYQPNTWGRDLVVAIYKAMVEAQPVYDISDDSVVETEVELTLDPEFVERMAIRLARGNNGGEWNQHYTDLHKEVWRDFVREVWPEFKNAPFKMRFIEQPKKET